MTIEEKNAWDKAQKRIKVIAAGWALAGIILGSISVSFFKVHGILTVRDQALEDIRTTAIFVENLVVNQQLILKALNEDASPDAKEILQNAEPFPIIIARKVNQ